MLSSFIQILSLLSKKRRDVYRLEKYSGQDIYSLETYIKALDTFLDKQIKNGVVDFKCHFFPYMRELKFDLVDPSKATRCLDKILRLPSRGATGSTVNVGFEEMTPFHNYIQNHMIHKAIEYDTPIQIHTGTFGGSMGSHIEYSKPTGLTDTFLRYPQARFNLLHSSFPYQRKLAEIVRLFPKVYLNAAWMDTLSPMAFKSFFKE